MRDDHNENTVVQRQDPLLGAVIASRFQIRDKIAAGGFGAIYRARHLASGNEVAIKVLHPQLAADPNVIARFRREGATLAKLRAPHTVTTYEFGEAADGMLYIVMELLRGVSLHERLRERGLIPWREALQIARAICISLAEAHALGIVHRDLKPANIHLETRGDADYVKVLDFGIAKIKRGTSMEDQPELTTAGQMIGTIDYMSPEQILGAQPDGRSDLFTLGIVLYEMIAGRRPFADSTTPTSMLAALLTTIPPRLGTFAPIPPALDEIVARCLLREAADRFSSVEELATEIDHVLATSSDDGATRTIMIGLQLQPDEEATVMADAAGHSFGFPATPRVNTLESLAPPPTPARMPPNVTPPMARLRPPTPAPAQRQHPPTPAPAQRQHPPTPAPAQRQHPPTPAPRQPFTPGYAHAHETQETPAPVYQPPRQSSGTTPAPGAPPHPAQTPYPQFQQPAQIPYPQWQAGQQQRQPTPAVPHPVVRQPTPAVPQPVVQHLTPPAIAVDNSGWQVPKAGRASQPMDPSAWQAYAGNATYAPPNDPGRPSQPFIPPGAPSFIPAERGDRGSGPVPAPVLKTYDQNRDVMVGRVIWVVAIVIVVALAIAIFKIIS